MKLKFGKGGIPGKVGGIGGVPMSPAMAASIPGGLKPPNPGGMKGGGNPK